jgi:negative regulator of flagellin synthesis FlgM
MMQDIYEIWGQEQMKIDELNQQAAVSYLSTARADKQLEVDDSHSEAAGKKQRRTDQVDISGYVQSAPVQSEREAIRSSRVEELKAQIAAGTYEVSSRAVAEKMLSKIVM